MRTFRVGIVSDDGLVDIVADGFDAGIRAGQHLALDMISPGPAAGFRCTAPASAKP